MTDWSKTKAGDEVIVPHFGKIKLTRPMYRTEWQGDWFWVAPGYRWIKSRQKFSGNALLSQFRDDEPKAEAPADAYPETGTADEKLAWYAARNLLRY